MPVLTKEAYEQLTKELHSRQSTLNGLLRGRPLKDAYEGCSAKGKWTHPDTLCATNGTASEIRMALEDFKTVLKEIERAVK